MQTTQISTSRDEEKELLEEQEEDEEECIGLVARRQKAYFHFCHKSSLAISVTLFLSILFNLYHGYSYHHKTCVVNSQQKPSVVAQPNYSGLEYNKSMTYYSKTDWQSENETISDELWDGLNMDSITVAISKDWAAEHGLPPSAPFYWDVDKALYHVKGIHGMHCLKYIRHFITRSRREGAPMDHHVVEHIGHCLDSLRQDIMCAADDTLMPGLVQGELGNNQVLQCRDWDALLRWAKDPERDSCFRQASDYKHVAHNLERHANCPLGSPYYDVSRKYFEIHGHKNLFSEDEE